MRIISHFLLVCAALAATIACAAQTGVVLRNEELRVDPFSDAKVLAPLPKDTRVEVLQHQGAWSLVKATGKQGWVRSINLRTGAADSGRAQGLLALESGRSGSGNAVATLGIRGANLKPAGKPAALQALENIAAGADTARALVLDASKTEFKQAEEPLQLSLLSARAGHVYVLRADAAGKNVELVFPNRIDGDNAVQAEQKLTLPRAGWSLVAGTPGRNHVLVVVSERPLELKFGDSDAAGRFERLPMSVENTRALQQKFSGMDYGAALIAIRVGQ